jgi:hypothetical protein
MLGRFMGGTGKRGRVSPEPPERFFVLTAGRTGSTLLSSILARAGADFGMPAIQSWDESRGGAFEHPEIVAAARYFRLAFDLSQQRPAGLRRWYWSHLYHRGKRHLARAAGAARYVKAVNLDLAVQSAAKLGYIPRIIVSYRRFGPQALSLSQVFARRTVDVLEADYLRTYRHALIQLHLYGGCVVGYDELLNPNETRWLVALAQVTGLPAPALIAASRAQPRLLTATYDVMPEITGETERLYGTLEGLAGRAIPISQQAVRNRNRRNRTEAAF